MADDVLCILVRRLLNGLYLMGEIVFGMDVKMRTELKYLCTEAQARSIALRVGGIMAPDEHQGPDGYTVRSLYFDTRHDRFLAENLASVDCREKIRMRSYGSSGDRMRLERKSSVGGKKAKEQTWLDASYARDLAVMGKFLPTNAEDPLIRDVMLLMKTEWLAPKAAVDYKRFAFVHPAGNVRVTLDRFIKASCNVDGFFGGEMSWLPLLPDEHLVLEVKYTGVLPGYIARALDIGMQRVTFSKYALSRNVLQNGGKIEEHYEL